MGAALAKVFFKTGEDDILAKYENVNQIPVKLINGEQTVIGDQVKGKKLYLIVNVASK